MDVGFLGNKFLALSFAKRREAFTTLNHSIMHSTGELKKKMKRGVLDFLPLILLAEMKVLSVLLGMISPVLSNAVLE